MTAQEEEQDSDREFLDALCVLSVPIFAVAIDGETERRPDEWQMIKSADNRGRLEQCRPQDALAALCGIKFTVIDIDPRNNGDEKIVRGKLAELGVKVYAEVRTGGGGIHLYIQHVPDLPSVHKLPAWPGVDVLSTGTNAYIPCGGPRPKHNGQRYRVTQQKIILVGGADQVAGRRFHEWVAAQLAERDAADGERGTPCPPGSLPWGDRAISYCNAMIMNEGRRVQAEPEGGRNLALFNSSRRVASKLAAFNTPEGVWRHAEEMLHAAAASNGLTRLEIPRTIRSGFRTGRMQPRAPVDRDMPAATPTTPAAGRGVALTNAERTRIVAVSWLWDQHIPLGEITLLGGREGIGKSSVIANIGAKVTMGNVPGDFNGTPKSVIVCATEDSWEATIVPRFMAAGADLSRVYRIDVTEAGGGDGTLTLPVDVAALAEQARSVDAALLILDPLMSRLDAGLDTHRDSDVRRALEPIRALAEQGRFAVVGLIHVNKGQGTDPIDRLMGSRAFTAVARSVLFAMRDPLDKEGDKYLFGCVKSNLGQSNRGTRGYTIGSSTVGYDTELDKPITAAHIRWQAPTNRTITEAMEDSVETMDVRTTRDEVKEWLESWFGRKGPTPRQDVLKLTRAAGYAESAVRRAFADLGGISRLGGFPRVAEWALPDQVTAGSPSLGRVPTEPTEPAGL